MSNLDYPISILEDKGAKFSTALLLSGVNQIQRTNHLAGITRAIDILKEEKMKDEREERGKKEREVLLEKYKKL